MFTTAIKASENIHRKLRIPTNDNLSPANYNSFNFLEILQLNLSVK